VFDRLMWNVELLLSNNVVHADLSPYNVLFWEGRVTMIDLPQAVDARTNMNSKSLLQRDIGNLCRYFGRFGIRADAERLTNELWRRFVFAKL
jgi:RIO kinase 1